MTRFTLLALSLAAAFVALPAQAVDADAAQALAKKSNCTKCHAVSAKKEGPSYKETAAKYKGKADAEQKLVTHLTTGPKVGEFEEVFAERVGRKYAVSYSSGTAALHGAAFAAGLKPGDEAITTPLTFAATANCVLYQGARPVFADVCNDTLNIDPDEVARRITSKTRAVLPVDYAGHPADLDPIVELAKKHGVIVIEDACHALGAEHQGRKAGSVGDMAVFSFHPVKHVATGEGGMVVTDNDEFAAEARLARSHGMTSQTSPFPAAGHVRCPGGRDMRCIVPRNREYLAAR